MKKEIENTIEEEAIDAKVEMGTAYVSRHKQGYDLGLKKELERYTEMYDGKDDIFGMTLLTNPGYISSSRNMMFTSHLKQFRNLEKPEFPKVFTHYENAVGHNSTAYYKAKHDFEIVKIIPKFGTDHKIDKYTIFVYDKHNDKYDIIEKKLVENLTEKFGYSYNNENLDSKNEGDKIKKGEWLYKSTSYDEDNNYCYGKNATYMYGMPTKTIEDGIIISRSFAESTIVPEIETRTVSINFNDILVNTYGTGTDYKVFPDIGERIANNILCVKRRIKNDQVLFDLKLSNLKKINYLSDDICYCDDAEVIDIEVYCNVPLDEVPDNRFYSQIKKYLILQKEYNQAVFDMCEEIFESDSKYTKAIGHLFSKARDILDPDVKWCDNNNNNAVFGFLNVEFTVKRLVGLAIGQKLTGRYGNKGVITEIRDDDKMPILDNGKRVDVIFNVLGVGNRLNSFQLFEQSITFICNRTVEKLKTIDSLHEREELLFDIIKRFQYDEYVDIRESYFRLTETGKELFFNDIYEDGIYIHIKPLWEKDKFLFDIISDIYDDYPWIKPYKVYMNINGSRRKIMKDIYVGEMYMMVLKQTSQKGFSADASGNISQKGVPQKPAKTKENRGKELYSKTAVRLGIDENYNSLIAVNELSLAKLHLFYRNSVIGRRHLGEQLMSDINQIDELETPFNFKNRNVEILNALFKNMGLRLNFDDDDYKIDIYDGSIVSKEHDGVLFIGQDDEIDDDILKHNIDREFEEDFLFIGDDEHINELKQKRFNFIKTLK